MLQGSEAEVRAASLPSRDTPAARADRKGLRLPVQRLMRSKHMCFLPSFRLGAKPNYILSKSPTTAPRPRACASSHIWRLWTSTWRLACTTKALVASERARDSRTSLDVK